jgi:signal transduction histidine kinase
MMAAALDFYARMFESVPVAVCIVDREGRILLLNSALERLLGWRLSVQRGQPIASYLQQAIIDPAQALCWTVALSEALALGKMTYLNLPVGMRTRFDDEHLVSVAGVVIPYQHDGTEHQGALVVFHGRDLMQSMEAVRARFFAAISHELGSPVSNIAAAADLLTKYLDTDNLQQRKLLRIIQAEAARLQRLMEQFLPKSPVQETAPAISKNVITLRPLIHRVVEIFRIRETGHRIVAQAPRDLPFVWGDEDGIQGILSNLLENALRYSPSGTEITLAAERGPQEVLISVTDQGPGLSAEDRERLFEPFYRGERKKEEVQGQGLGLPIARSVVQELGGELWYEERAEGGIRFCFTLPSVSDPVGDEDEGEEGRGDQDPGH